MVTRDVRVEVTVPSTVGSEITTVGDEMDRQLQAFETTEHGYSFSPAGAAAHEMLGAVGFVVVVCFVHGFLVVVGGFVAVACLGSTNTEHRLSVLVLCSC